MSSGRELIQNVKSKFQTDNQCVKSHVNQFPSVMTAVFHVQVYGDR